MSFTNYIILLFIFLGAVIMLVSAAYAKKIFALLTDDNLKNNWEKLRVLMFVFFVGNPPSDGPGPCHGGRGVDDPGP